MFLFLRWPHIAVFVLALKSNNVAAACELFRRRPLNEIIGGKIEERAAQVARRVVNGTLGMAESKKFGHESFMSSKTWSARLIWVWSGLLS